MMFKNLLLSLSFIFVCMFTLHAQKVEKMRRLPIIDSVPFPPSSDCEDFNTSPGHWMRSNVSSYYGNHVYPSTNTETGSSGQAGDYALDGFDDSGADRLYNQVDYKGNILERGECFCFDFKVINSELADSVQPVIYFYQGDISTSPVDITKQIVFKANHYYTNEDGWIRICAPLELAVDGLPSNGEGQWSVSGSTGNTAQDIANFNDVITNLDGIYFYLDMCSDPREVYAFDNICISDDCSSSDSDDAPIGGAFCCDQSENLIANANFEQGNSGFTSEYTANSSTLPGQYSVSNSASAFNATVNDHSFCADPVQYANHENYLLINGLTNQPAGSASVVYNQELALTPGEEYRFCANFKNLPQCNFDVLPKIQIELNGEIIVPYTTIDAIATDPCDWINLSGCFTAREEAKAELKIYLKGDGIGDGNDLAIDDISMHQLSDPGYSLNVTHNGGNQTVTATVNPFPFLNELCEFEDSADHYWFVYKTTTPNNPWPITSSFAWSDNSGSYGTPVTGNAPWTVPTTNFPTYPTFADNAFYVVGIYVPSCCETCQTDGWAYQITYNTSSLTTSSLSTRQDDVLTDAIKAKIKSLFIKSSGDLGFNAPEKQNGMKLYPNPSNGEFRVQLNQPSTGSLQVFNIAGQRLFTDRFNTQQQVNVNLSHKAPGVYFVKLKTKENRVYTKKIIIK